MARVLSALVLLPIVVGVVWFLPPAATLALALVAAALALHEYVGIARALGTAVPFALTGVAVVAACAAVGLAWVPLDVVLMSALIVFGALAVSAGQPGPPILRDVSASLFAVLYIGLPLGAIARSQALFGPAAVTWFIAIIAISDTAQFYAGRLIGIRKLAPLVSPAKTVEGAAGGFAATAIAGAALAAWGAIALEPIVAAMLAVLLAGIGMCGDLFESMLKRSAGVKDSAAVIPGHGGVLDRLDSYLFAGPVFYLFMRFVA
jgi:phosphatidate cytidylyltransferase